MGVIVDHTGEQFGKLKAIRRIETPKAQKTKYLCECACGVTKTTAEWARVTGISAVTLNSRLMRGWTIERILNTQVMKRGVEN